MENPGLDSPGFLLVIRRRPSAPPIELPLTPVELSREVPLTVVAGGGTELLRVLSVAAGPALAGLRGTHEFEDLVDSAKNCQREVVIHSAVEPENKRYAYTRCSGSGATSRR